MRELSELRYEFADYQANNAWMEETLPENQECFEFGKRKRISAEGRIVTEFSYGEVRDNKTSCCDFRVERAEQAS